MRLLRTIGDLVKGSRRHELERRVAALSLSTIAVTFALLGNAFAAACLRDDRMVKFADGSSRMRSYICKLENSDIPKVRVELHRLSEVSAGNVLQNLLEPVTDKILGKPKILQTDVGTEAKKLFDEFGSKQLVSRCIAFSVATPKGGKDYKGSLEGPSGCGERMLSFFNKPRGPKSIFAPSMPLPDDTIHIKKKTSWPPNYSFFYTDRFCSSQIGCTVIWRPASMSDVNNHKQNWKLENKLYEIEDSDETQEGDFFDLEKYFNLAKHLMRDGWQNDFLTVTGFYDDCGSYLFGIYPRELILDVATIENISSAKINVDGFLVSENAGPVLRKSTALLTEGGSSAKTIASPTELMPKEKAVVPLRMTWSVVKGFRDIFADSGGATRKYAQLRNSAPGTVFNIRDDRRIVVRKTRESFGEPSVPSMDDFIYGPSLDVTAFLVNGEKILFAERSRNFLQVTASNPVGSCPFLYAWHPKAQSWIWFGKVIHKANSKAKEMTHEIPLTSFATRFRLSEEELELSHIDHVSLTLELHDGTRHVLKPNHPALSEADNKYVRIQVGNSIEFEFNPPSSVNAATVKRSALRVKGYYEPYSRLNIGESSETPSIAPVEFRNR